MTIEKENKTALKEAFDAELLKQLEENPPEIPSYEKFSSMIDGEVKKRRRRIHIISTAASIALLFLAGIVTYPYFAPDIQADKNPKEEIITEDGVIIEDGGWGSSDGEDNVWVIEEWEHVYDARKVYDDFLIPEYIPKEYSFDKLIVNSYSTGDIAYEYYFENNRRDIIELKLFYINGGETAMSVSNVTDTLACAKGNILLQTLDDGENKLATIQMDDGLSVFLIGNLSNEDIIRIIDKIND